MSFEEIVRDALLFLAVFIAFIFITVLFEQTIGAIPIAICILSAVIVVVSSRKKEK